MTELLITIAVLLAGIVWLVRRRRSPGTLLSFREGKLVRAEGRIAPRQRRALVDVARMAGITGEVHVVDDSALDFSDSISESERQRFRNAFLAHD